MDALFPDRCIYCSLSLALPTRVTGDYATFPICKQCYETKLKRLDSSCRCEICLSTLVENNCPFCRDRHVYFDKFLTPLLYNKEGSILLEAIKFKGRESLVLALVPLLFSVLEKDEQVNDLLVNSSLTIMEVPMSFFSFRKRGFSQLKMARKMIQRKWKLKEIVPLKKIAKPSQHFKNKIHRALEIQGSFKIKKTFQNKIDGNILLLDDVFTTGTTVNEVARLLKENGAKQVFVLCFFYRDLFIEI